MWRSKPLFPREKLRCASLLLIVGVMLGVGFMVRLSQLPPICFDVVFSFAWYVATTFCDSFRGNCSVYRMQCVHGTQDPLTSSFWTGSLLDSCSVVSDSLWPHGLFSSVQLLSRVWLSATPWIAARQASLSIPNSQSSLGLTSIEVRFSKIQY